MKYIHKQTNWPNLHWDSKKLSTLLASIRNKQGFLLGRMNSVGFNIRTETTLEVLTTNIIKSSEIEGEHLDKQQVRSSIARRLGLNIGGLLTIDRHIDGVVEMMLDATQKYNKPLTKKRLYSWHCVLFPTLRSGLRLITVGKWRPVEAGPMQVVSGPIGKEKIHYEAPDATRLQHEMNIFLDWFNCGAQIDPVIKAGIAHFWFITIHPFEDGNGRIARAISDMCLAAADNTSDRFYSMSSQIEKERKEYYIILETCQKGSLDITPWLEWFLGCLGRAIDTANNELDSIFHKTKIWEVLNQYQINKRQRKVVNCLLDNFQGKLTTKKYVKFTKCSHDTALRDIRKLIEYGVMKQNPSGGRSTSYCLINRHISPDRRPVA